MNEGNPAFRAVVVLFNPGADDLTSVMALENAGWRPVAVCNAISQGDAGQLRAAGVECRINTVNAGLAAALNQGMRAVYESGADYALLLDQDSRPPLDMAQALVTRARTFEASGGKLGVIGPTTIDLKSEGRDLKRNAGAPIAAMSVITSGCLIPRSAFEAVGPMWDDLFIDNIDHEWCFRARSKGFAVLIAPDVAMPHDLGDVSVKVAGSARMVHRSPLRHYHIVRNTLWLARQPHAPRAWRLGELARLVYRIPNFVLFSTDRAGSVKRISRGLIDGFKGPDAVP